jgi:hypothetical protein
MEAVRGSWTDDRMDDLATLIAAILAGFIGLLATHYG